MLPVAVARPSFDNNAVRYVLPFYLRDAMLAPVLGRLGPIAMSLCACVCVCACVRARACVRACVCVFVSNAGIVSEWLN